MFKDMLKDPLYKNAVNTFQMINFYFIYEH